MGKNFRANFYFDGRTSHPLDTTGWYPGRSFGRSPVVSSPNSSGIVFRLGSRTQHRLSGDGMNRTGRRSDPLPLGLHLSLVLLLNLHLKLRMQMELITMLARKLALVDASAKRAQPIERC